LWGRTNCNSNGVCETGNCGLLQCASGGVNRGGAPPATLAEFNIGAGGTDWYDVSLVDGYNLPMTIVPQTMSSGGSGKYWCTSPTCTSDLNAICPSALQVISPTTKKVIACKSACSKYNLDFLCCSGKHNTPATCKSADWGSYYYIYTLLKQACPTAYAYAYDDNTSTFTCRNTNYAINFC
jgi:hypothetical protein